MDQLLFDLANIVPLPYLRAVVSTLLLLKLLDEIVRRIPDRWIAGHTFVEAVLLNFKRLRPIVDRLLQRLQRPPSGPTAAGGAAAVLLVLFLPSIALADQPAAEVRPLPPDPVASVPSTPPVAAPAVPNVALLPDCISQGAANAALACVSGKAPPPTDRKTFWITWGTSMGSTVATAALAWVVNHYALNPDPIK